MEYQNSSKNGNSKTTWVEGLHTPLSPCVHEVMDIDIERASFISRKLLKVAEHSAKSRQSKALSAEKEVLLDRINQLFNAYDHFDHEFLSQEEMNPVATESIETEPYEGGNFNTRRFQLQVESLVAIKENDLELAVSKAEMGIELWGNASNMKRANPLGYRIEIFNMLHLLALGGKYIEFPKWFRELDKNKVTGDAEILYENQSRYLFELVYLLNTSRIRELSLRLGLIEAWFQEFQEKIPFSRRLVFQVNLGIAHLFLKNYTQARKWNDLLLSSGKSGVRMELQMWCRALDLILCYEQGLDDLLAYRLRSAERYFRSWSSLPLFGRLVLDTFKGILKYHSTPQIKPYLVEIYTKLQGQIRVAEQPPGCAEFILWVRSLLLETPIQSLILEGDSENRTSQDDTSLSQ